MDANDIEVSLKMKKKGWLSIEEDTINFFSSSNYNKLFSFWVRIRSDLCLGGSGFLGMHGALSLSMESFFYFRLLDE